MNIGKPLLINMVKPTLESLATRLGAKLYKKMNMNEEGIHEFIQLNGLTFHTTNYTLVLDYQHLPNFSTNVT